MLTCAVTIEQTRGAAATTTTRTQHKKAELSLARNEFREVLLMVAAPGERRRSFVLNNDKMRVHRRFAAEGKLTVALADSGVTLMVSNAPPHKLVVFAKTMAAKLAQGDENK